VSSKPSIQRRLLRTKEAAEYLRLSAWQIRQLTANGKIPVIQYDDRGKFFFDMRDLDAFIERNRRVGPL